jgi:hypothetical protein
MVTSQAQREVVLELLLPGQAGAQSVLPVGENPQKAHGRVAEIDETSRLRRRQLQERRGIPDLRNQSLPRNPLRPRFSANDGVGQATMMRQVGRAPNREDAYDAKRSFRLTSAGSSIF